MTASVRLHVAPKISRGPGWAVRWAGSMRCSKIFRGATAKWAALGYALKRAEKASCPIYVHRRDGTVQYVIDSPRGGAD